MLFSLAQVGRTAFISTSVFLRFGHKDILLTRCLGIGGGHSGVAKVPLVFMKCATTNSWGGVLP